MANSGNKNYRQSAILFLEMYGYCMRAANNALIGEPDHDLVCSVVWLIPQVSGYCLYIYIYTYIITQETHLNQFSAFRKRKVKPKCNKKLLPL